MWYWAWAASLTRCTSTAGPSIVIHAKPDDYKTDPSGNSGDRIACGPVAL